MTTPATPPQGGDPTSGATGASTPPAPPASPPSEARSAAAEFIASKGGPQRAVRILLRDNHALREKNRELGTRPAAPPADAVVLTGDDAKAWTAFRALGTPKELQDKLDAGTQATTRLAALEAERTIGEMAQAVGYNARLLTLALRERPDARLELREVEVEEKGQKVKRSTPHVVVGTGDAAKAEPLTTWAPREFADVPFTARASGGAAGGANGSAGAPPPGPRYPDQREAGAAAPGSAEVVGDYLKSTTVLPSQRKAKA